MLKASVSRFWGYVLLILLFAGTFYPFILMFMSSFKYQMQMIKEPWFFSFPLHFDNYAKAFTKIYLSMGNSVIVVLIGILVTLLVSSMAAFSFAKFEFPGKNFFFFFIIMLLMIPGFALLIPQFIQIKDLGLYNTYLGQALPPASNNAALGVLLMRTFFEGIPRSLFEAAEIEGCGEAAVFAKIVIPLSKPIIATVAIMGGLVIWNNFVWSLVCTTGEKVRPVILAITLLEGNINQGDGLKLAGYVLAALPLLVMFFFATKPFVSGLTAGAVKG